MIRGIDHVSIDVSELGRSVDFYCDKLGFRVSRTLGTSELNIAFLELGSSSIELLARRDSNASLEASPRKGNLGLAHIAFRVSNIDEVFSELRDKGVEFSSPPYDAEGGPRIVFFKDPDGVVLELIQWR